MLIGGLGADILDGGIGFDWARYDSSNAGINVNLVSGPGTGGHAAGDTYSNIEYVMGSNYGDTITGNNINNYLMGLAGVDTITAGDGSDYLLGGDGADQLYGGLGNDQLLGGDGADLVDGGAGYDWARYTSSPEAGDD